MSEAELDSAFDDLEDADHHLAGDLGFVGVLANAVVSPHAPVPNLTVDVLPTPHGTGVRADVAQGNADTRLYVRVIAT